MSESGFIYAIGVPGHASVKIGRTSGPVAKRLAALQTSHPEPLKLMAHAPVERDLSKIEKAVHHFLAAYRRNGEWFDITIADDADLAQLVVRAVEWMVQEEGRRSEGGQPHPSEDLLAGFSARVVALRKARGWTRRYLAGRATLNEDHLFKVEHGTRTRIEPETVIKLAKALDVTTDYLLGLSDQASRDSSRAAC